MSETVKPPETTPANPITEKQRRLLEMLSKEPPLQEALFEALKTENWFITVSRPHINFRAAKCFPAGDKIRELNTIMDEVTHDPDYLSHGYKGAQYLI